MNKNYFIGTIHGIVKKEEVLEIFERYSPEVVFVEIKNEDLLTKKFKKYPLEMKYAYDIAKRKDLKIIGFDWDAGEAETKMTEEQKKILHKFLKRIMEIGWKELNKEKYHDEMMRHIEDVGEDMKAFRIRQQHMYENIKSNLPEKGDSIIFMGAGHIHFFSSKFKDAIFPFRE